MARTNADTLRFNDDGTVTIGICGTLHRVGRATIGQYRAFGDQLRGLQTRLDALRQAAKDDERVNFTPDELVSIDDATLDVWQWIIENLSDKPDQWPADRDDLPVWMTETEWFSELSEHWKSGPLDGPRPTKRKVAETLEVLGKTKQALGGSS